MVISRRLLFLNGWFRSSGSCNVRKIDIDFWSLLRTVNRLPQTVFQLTHGSHAEMTISKRNWPIISAAALGRVTFFSSENCRILEETSDQNDEHEIRDTHSSMSQPYRYPREAGLGAHAEKHQRRFMSWRRKNDLPLGPNLPGSSQIDFLSGPVKCDTKRQPILSPQQSGCVRDKLRPFCAGETGFEES
jgi:hypothetical protein